MPTPAARTPAPPAADAAAARDELARGQKLFASGDVAGARAAFEAAIAKDERLAAAHYWRGRACVVKSAAMSYSLAIDSFTRALELDPALIEAHWGLGLARIGYSHAAEAEREFTLFLAGATDAQPAPMRGEAEHFLGVLARERGDVEGALARFERAESLHPSFAEAPYERGLTLEAAGRDDEALAAFLRAVATEPGHLPSHHRLARLYGRLGREADAQREERIHRVLLALSDDLSGRTIRAPQRRLELYSELAGLEPRHLRARIEVARALVELGRDDEAVLLLDELLAGHPSEPALLPAYVVRGELALEARDERRAAATMAALAAAFPALDPAGLPAPLRALFPKR